MSVYWRFKNDVPGPWRYGWMTQVGSGLVRMGWWNGDTTRGPIVDPNEIETRPHS